jgi:hypothetical protein
VTARPGDTMPIQHKLGYDQMQEMSEIRLALANQGVTGTILHFRAVSEYERRHCGEPSYRERQQAWLARQKPSAPVLDYLILALREIRDGHNDPRTLAREVLALLGEP